MINLIQFTCICKKNYNTNHLILGVGDMTKIVWHDIWYILFHGNDKCHNIDIFALNKVFFHILSPVSISQKTNNTLD